jgi:hypothetical protein
MVKIQYLTDEDKQLAEVLIDSSKKPIGYEANVVVSGRSKKKLLERKIPTYNIIYRPKVLGVEAKDKGKAGFQLKNIKIGKDKQCENLSDVYRLGCVHNGRRVKMHHLGLDVGTKTIVVAYRNDDKTEYISEINGYYVFERATPFIENMLNDPNKVRSDGTQRPARWIKLENGQIIVLGRDAEEFAYAKNDTLLRPMAEGGITADEESLTVLASIIHGLLETAETELGQFDDELKLCYCTTAPAINKESNLSYHERVVNMVIDNYESKAKISKNNIKESHAIVLNMSQDGTGIGISWGAGTVTISYVRMGIEIYSFCWVGAGDWIDEQVAMRHGYNPERSRPVLK